MTISGFWKERRLMPEFTDYKVADIAPGRLGPARDRDRRDRDAGTDGVARRVRRGEAAVGARIVGCLT